MSESKGIMLDRAALEAIDFAGTEGRYSSPATQGIAVHPDGKVEATNVHMLIRLKPSPDPPDEFPLVTGMGESAPKGITILPSDAVKATLKNLPRKSHIPILRSAHLGTNGAEGKVVLTTTDLEIGIPRLVQTVQGQFPDIENVIPKSAPTASLSFNPEYMATICQYAKRQGAKMITLEVFDKDLLQVSAMKLTFNVREGSQKALVVLMPMRGDK